MDLPLDLLRGIFGIGFIKPSVIQSKGIVPVKSGKDVIAQAQSGSGKTATFGIGLLAQLDLDPNSNLEKSGSKYSQPVMPQILILAPTRELADQIYNVLTDLSSQMKDVKIYLSIGGSRPPSQNIQAHVVVGTPGRVYDMIKRGKLPTTYLKSFVLDEADNLLGYGFIEQINNILKEIPSDSQIGIFSATMGQEVIDLCQKIMSDPIKILVKNENLTLAGIKQFYISCSNDDTKYENLKQIFMNMEIVQCIIYANKIDTVDYISEKLKEDGFVITTIHGQMRQEERN